MRTLNLYPKRLMAASASGSFQDHCDIFRNDGYGSRQIGQSRCNVHHRLTPPLPADPADANAASVEFAEIHLPLDFPVRISDTIVTRGERWSVGGGNFSESYATYKRAMVGRPTAATPQTFITLRRYNPSIDTWQTLPPQLVHIAWQKSQPDRLGGIAVRQFGYIFAPSDSPDLNVMQGDTFYYAEREGVVTWVSPDPTERREATFSMNVGEGT